MKTLLLAVLLSMGLSMSAFSNASSDVFVPIEGVTGMGGFHALSVASKIVGLGVVAIVIQAAYNNRNVTCEIVKIAPLPGTNYTNEKSVCTES